MKLLQTQFQKGSMIDSVSSQKMTNTNCVFKKTGRGVALYFDTSKLSLPFSVKDTSLFEINLQLIWKSHNTVDTLYSLTNDSLDRYFWVGVYNGCLCMEYATDSGSEFYSTTYILKENKPTNIFIKHDGVAQILTCEVDGANYPFDNTSIPVNMSELSRVDLGYYADSQSFKGYILDFQIGNNLDKNRAITRLQNASTLVEPKRDFNYPKPTDLSSERFTDIGNDKTRDLAVAAGSPTIIDNNNIICNNTPVVDLVANTSYWAVGRKYKITAVVTNYTGTGQGVLLPYDGTTASLVVTENGRYEVIYTPQDIGNMYMGAYSNTGASLQIESIREFTGLVAAYNMIPSAGGVLKDISGNGNDGTIHGALSNKDGMSARNMKTKISFNSITISRLGGSISFTMKPYSFAITGSYSSQNYIATNLIHGKFKSNIYITPDGNLCCESMVNSEFWCNLFNKVIINQTSTVSMVAKDSIIKTYVNEELASTKTVTADLILDGLFGNQKSEVLSNLGIQDFRFYNKDLSEKERKDYHNKNAKQVYIKDTFKFDLADGVSRTPIGWKKGTGAFKVRENTNGKHLECVSAGTIALRSNQAYGTWEFDINRSNQCIIHIISDSPNRISDNGYHFYIQPNNQIGFGKRTNGSGSNIFTTALGYVENNTDYRIKITRSLLGEFTVYIKGGSFGENYVIISTTGGSGTNPVINNIYTISNHIVAFFNAGDKLGNVLLEKGIVV